MRKFILGEKLKVEIGGKKVIAAVFTSFNFDPDFFENYLLPLLLPDVPFGDNKIQNTILWKKFQSDLPPITVFCDFNAKSQKGIHLNYTIHTIDFPRVNGIKPCFHPKHTYILLEDESLLVFIGSNNLTEAGWCSNLEGVNFFRLKPRINLPAIFKKQLQNFIEEIEKDKIVSEASKVMSKQFFKRQTYTQESDFNLIYSRKFNPAKNLSYLSSFISDLTCDKNKGIPFKKIEVISPYYASNIELFKELQEISQCSDISLSIPFENTDYVALDDELFKESKNLGFHWKVIKGMNDEKGYRFNHTKIYQFVGEETVFILVGSLNFTNMAWKGIRNGGNEESAILYKFPVDQFEPLLVDYPLEQLKFTGHKQEENHIDQRIDAYNIKFIIDWALKQLEINNFDPANQKGYILLGDTKIQLGESQKIKLKDNQLQFLSNNPLIEVKPEKSLESQFYYPIHQNIESKPLPDNIKLNDTELLQLWIDLRDATDNETTLRIIDRFIDRVTDESGEIIEEAIAQTSSTLNLMATHLSGLIHLNKKIFVKGGLKRELPGRKKMLEYYLFSDNVDTLKGYRKLLQKMASDGRLNPGFHWVLLVVLQSNFYQRYINFEYYDESNQILLDLIGSELKKEINQLAQALEDDRVSKKHLNWAKQMITQDAE